MDFKTDKQLTLKCLSELTKAIKKEIGEFEVSLLRKLTEYNEDNKSYLSFKFKHNESPIFSIFCEQLNQMLKDLKASTRDKKKELFKSGLKNLYEPYKSASTSPIRQRPQTPLRNSMNSVSANPQKQMGTTKPFFSENKLGKKLKAIEDYTVTSFFPDDLKRHTRPDKNPSTVKREFVNIQPNVSEIAPTPERVTKDDLSYSEISDISNLISTSNIFSPQHNLNDLSFQSITKTNENSNRNGAVERGETSDFKNDSFFKKQSITSFDPLKNKTIKEVDSQLENGSQTNYFVGDVLPPPDLKKFKEQFHEKITSKNMTPVTKPINFQEYSESQYSESEDYNIFRDENFDFTIDEEKRVEIIESFKKNLEVESSEDCIESDSDLKKSSTGMRYHEMSPGLRIIAKENGLSYTNSVTPLSPLRSMNDLSCDLPEGLFDSYKSVNKFSKFIPQKIEYKLPYDRTLQITDLSFLKITSPKGEKKILLEENYFHPDIGFTSGKSTMYLRINNGDDNVSEGTSIVNQNFFFFVDKSSICFINPKNEELNPIYFRKPGYEIVDVVEDYMHSRLIILTTSCTIFYKSTFTSSKTASDIEDKSLSNLSTPLGKALALTPDSEYLIIGYESTCGNGQQEDNFVIRKLGDNGTFEPFAATYLSGSKGKQNLDNFFSLGMGIDDVGYRVLNKFTREYVFILYGRNYKFDFELKGDRLVEMP